MRLAVVAVGRLKGGPERDLALRYHERGAALGRTLGLSPLDLVELPESRARRSEDRRTEEGAAILDRLGPAAAIVFDETGRAMTSEAFAERLRAWRDEGAPAAACVIGGPDGFSGEVRGRARLLIAFGALTLPHQLVRILVLEQLYRAMTILSGHPYHRAGSEPR